MRGTHAPRDRGSHPRESRNPEELSAAIRARVVGRAAATFVLFVLCFGLIHATEAGAATNKPRVVLMNDPELDDQNTLVRYLLYSNEFDTEGLIYISSAYHWAGDGKGTKWYVPGREYASLNLCPCTSWRWKAGEKFIDDAVDIYGQVYPNLKAQDSDYRTPDSLKSKIYTGNIQFDGDISQDSPGSNRIRELLLDDQPGPLYLLTGGGPSTLARALKSIKQQYEGTADWPAVYQKVSRKAIIQSWGDQDDTYAQYIQPNWPEIQFRDMRTMMWGFLAHSAVLPQDAYLLRPAWMKANVSDVGPFGSFYRVWGDGKQMVPGDITDFFGFSGLTAAELQAMGYAVWLPIQEQGSWSSEGDTPIFMNLVDNGLRGYQDATFGGWGGRSGTDKNPAGVPNAIYASARWFNAAQQDFAARMKWSVTPTYSGANHEPVVTISGLLNISAAPGETVHLAASASDPDGNALTYTWWQYTDAGTYPGAVSLTTPNTLSTSFEVPANSVIPPNAVPGQTIHMILEVTDNGTPALKSYQRVIVTVAARTTSKVSGNVTSTLGLTLGAAPSFGAFTPGTAKTYSATTTATVTSTAAAAVLTVGDGSPIATGYLVNGASALTSPLQIKASSGGGIGGHFAPLTAITSPTTLLSYGVPVTNDAVTLSYQQALGANDALRSGSYSKTLTYTLSTPSP